MAWVAARSAPDAAGAASSTGKALLAKRSTSTTLRASLPRLPVHGRVGRPSEPSTREFSMTLFSLEGRTAIVTGGNGGIGRGIALALAAAGAKVCVAGRNDDKNDRACAEIAALGSEATRSALRRQRRRRHRGDDRGDGRGFRQPRYRREQCGHQQINSPEAMTDQEWESVINTTRSPASGPRSAGVARRKVKMLNAATTLADLRVQPGGVGWKP